MGWRPNPKYIGNFIVENENQSDETQTVNALMPFSQAHSTSLISVNRQIENDIDNGLERTPELWVKMSQWLVPNGCSGGRSYDHANVAIFLMVHIPVLKKYTNLNTRGIYERFVQVVKRRGFIMVGGYIEGHTRDNETVPTEDAVAPIAEADTENAA